VTRMVGVSVMMVGHLGLNIDPPLGGPPPPLFKALSTGYSVFSPSRNQYQGCDEEFGHPLFCK
jgi:hypothetical protein